MSRVSRKKKNRVQEIEWLPKYRAASYTRVSIKNGGHGREDTLNVQQEICKGYIKKDRKWNCYMKSVTMELAELLL